MDKAERRRRDQINTAIEQLKIQVVSLEIAKTAAQRKEVLGRMMVTIKQVHGSIVTHTDGKRLKVILEDAAVIDFASCEYDNDRVLHIHGSFDLREIGKKVLW